MSIALTRVDFRLIHGQVITRWLKQCDINEIVTVDTAQELTNAINAGLALPEIQIGGLGGGPGRKAVNNAITLDRKDADQLLAIESKGINVYFQTTPDYPSETLQNAVKKLA